MLNRVGVVLCAVGVFAGCQDVDQGMSDVSAVQFSVPDMMCEEGCAAAVKDILSKQPGAKDVVVDFDAKLATVAADEGTFDAQHALAALVDKGFEHSSVKEPTTAVAPPVAAPR